VLSLRVLVTGAQGQVGTALLASAPSGLDVIGCSRAELDIADPSAVRAGLDRHRPDLIVNAAAYTAVDRAESEATLAWRVNADGPRNLAAAAQAHGARLVHLSTDFVFDGSATVPYAPDAETRPLNTYGRTKRAGEEAVLEHLGSRAVVLRTAWVYSAGGSNFVRTMLRLMAAEGSVWVVKDQFGTPTAAGSIARAIWALAARPLISGIKHWTDAGAASRYEFALAIAEEGAALGLVPAAVTVHPIATADRPAPAARPRYSVLDTGTLPAELGLTRLDWRVQLRGVLREIQCTTAP
jgi:dTDP-4-dehydrorhamnose reductase